MNQKPIEQRSKSNGAVVRAGVSVRAMLHEGEIEVDESSVRRLISEQFPQWKDCRFSRVRPEGTSNVLYRIGEKWIARFPRTQAAVEQVEKEMDWLPRLADFLHLPIPVPVAQGRPSECFPRIWSVYEWLEGVAHPKRGEIDQPRLAKGLANFIKRLQNIDIAGGPLPGSHNFYRGVQLRSRDEQTREAIAALGGMIDVNAVTRLWEASLKVPEASNSTWIHGDLLPGNLLFNHGQLVGIIDFGGLGVGDPACDLMPAWNFLSKEARETFRDLLEVDESTWVRGCGWALSQALVYVPYYLEKRPEGVSNALRVIREMVAGHRSSTR